VNLEADFILLHASELLTCAGTAPARGTAQSSVGAIPGGALAAHRGTLVYVGPSGSLSSNVTPLRDAAIFDLRGCSAVVPGFVDAHTHAAYAGERRGELRRRLAGETYAQVGASGGGILATVTATRSASEEELVAATGARLDEMLAAGTTTCEIKSGYGLTTASELTMLRAVRALERQGPLSIASTFLGAHEVPPEYRTNTAEYVDLVIEEMIPAVARHGLAEWCDVFCEEGVFTPDQSRRILAAGAAAGLKPRIHADELGSSGGARVAAELRARSADHLIFVSPADVAALAEAGVTATLLPIAAFYLKLGRFAPARDLIAAGVPVALGTDVNPGGGLSPSMPFAMALACFSMDMTFEEALVAATLNGAWSLDRAGTAGSLEPGKLADAVVVDGDPVNLLRVGSSSIRAVIKRGQIVSGALP
jgi:imidazolonepropionase